MNQFLTRFSGEQLDDGVNWRVISELRYQDELLGFLTVPAGFITDGGSIPPFFQGLINPYGKGLKAFVVHDWLYATQKFNREQSDECLRRALGACGENILDQETQFNAVRFGGSQAWFDDQKKYGLKGA